MLLRLLRIAHILARHDALAPLEEAAVAPGIVWLARLVSRREAGGRAGQKLARALVELGPSFIKLGQVLSTRADLLGEQMAEDLAELQDRLPPFPGDVAKSIIAAELGQSIETMFESFDNEPISAASIAQVHFAVSAEGDPVAVKVLRPGVEQAFERDLELFNWLAALVETTRPKLRRFKPLAVVALFEETVRIEMDLRMEAAAAAELAENFADDPSYRTPRVDWQRSSRRVLTMGRIGGIPLDDREALIAAGHDLEEILNKAATIFFNQVFRDGFFHGDQHPGNMSVDEAGNIVAVDFGIMGRLDLKTRCYLADMLVATLAGDYQRLSEVNVEAGYLPPGRPPESFAQALRAVCEPISGRPLNEISFAHLLAQLLQLTESYDMPVQPQLLLLQKNMLMAEGISRQLVPELNIWSLAQPLIEDWVRDNRGPEARLRAGARSLLASLERLPETLANIEAAAADAAAGDGRLNRETVKGLQGRNSGGTWHIRFLWLAIAALALILLLR